MLGLKAWEPEINCQSCWHVVVILLLGEVGTGGSLGLAGQPVKSNQRVLRQ